MGLLKMASYRYAVNGEFEKPAVDTVVYMGLRQGDAVLHEVGARIFLSLFLLCLEPQHSVRRRALSPTDPRKAVNAHHSNTR